MHFYLEPFSLRQWVQFETGEHLGHIEHFIANRSMQIGDGLLVFVRRKTVQESGIQAYGEILCSPYVFLDAPDDPYYGKLVVDVRIDRIDPEKPFLMHEQCKRFTGQFTSVHVISDTFNEHIKTALSALP